MDNEDQEVTIKDLIIKVQRFYSYLKTKWIRILLIIILGGVLGFVYATYKKPRYVANLNFVIEDAHSSGMVGAAGLASQFGFDFGGTENGAFSGDNLIELLKTRALVEKTLLSGISVSGKTQTLAELYINFNDYKNKWKPKEGLNNVVFDLNAPRNNFSLKQDSLLGEFYKEIIKNNLIVDKSEKKLSIISIIVTSKNELFSKVFSEKLLENVSKFYIETKTKKEAENVTILQNQTDSVKRQLNFGIAGVASSMDLNPNPNRDLQILRAPSQRRQIDVQANVAILNELVKNLELSKITLRKETPLVQVIDLPILPLDILKTSRVKGIVIGCTLGAFISVLIITVRLLYKKIMGVGE